MTLFESFLTALDDVFGVVVTIADCLLPITILILLIVWLTQRSSVKNMIRAYGSDEEYENARLKLVKRSKVAMSIGWFLFAAGLVVMLCGLTWVTYVESNSMDVSMNIWNMKNHIVMYSVFAWFGGLCLVFARFVYLETKSMHLLRARQTKLQGAGNAGQVKA